LQRLLWFLLLLLLLSLTFGVSLGPVPIPVAKVWGIAADRLGLSSGGDWSTAQANIVWLIRFPRVLLAAFVGGGLAVVGVTLQALVRNPLADPFLLGITAGASVGAVLAIGLGVFAFAGVYGVSVGAFAGALIAFLAVFLMAQRGGRMTPQRLILAGVAVSYVFSGVTSFLTITSENRLLAGQVLSWTLGSLARARWADLTLPALALLLGTLYLILQARALNALATDALCRHRVDHRSVGGGQRQYWLYRLGGAPHGARLGGQRSSPRLADCSLGRQPLPDLGRCDRPHRL
jgi:iron complex transport system permease protein